MAVDFGEGNVNKYYVVTADTSLDLPDGDWCVGWWYRIEDNAGSGFHFPFSWGGLDGNNSFNAYMAEDSQGDATRVRNFVLDILDVDYNRYEDQGNWLAGDANDINIGDNELVIFQRAGDTCYIYTAPVGGPPTEQGQDTNALFTTCALSTDLYIGAYQGLTTAWFHDEHMGEVFLMHDSLSTEEIGAIAAGVPVGQLNKDLRLWLDFKNAAATVVDLSGNGNDAARNGTPDTSEHFPVKHNKPNLVIVPTAAGVSLVIQDAAHAHTADNLALTQVHALAINDASHGHAADNIGLTQDHQLTIQEALHSHSAENITLSTAIDLLINAAAHSHIADNIALTQDHQLVIQESNHAHAADNIALTQLHVLFIDEALHSHLADQCDVTTATALVIADALHTHVADNLLITQAHQLAIANALHAHVSDNITLTQNHILIINNALHAHISDILTLSIASFDIVPTSRVYAINYENRVYYISTEDRTYSIDSENRTYYIED